MGLLGRAFLLCLLAFWADSASLAEVLLPRRGSELQKAPVLHSEGGLLNCTLRLRPARFVGAEKSFVTRVYNDIIPGPTIVVQPGDRLLVTLKNDLEAPEGPVASNTYQLPNTTNLHVHGLHVSPKAPADEVFFTIIGPQQSYSYDYAILRDHSPGIYWAHPHHHGSTVVQAGAGAASALVVADPPGFLTKQLESMPDHILMLQNLPFILLDKAAQLSDDELFHTNSNRSLWLVNGAEEPVLTVRSNEWHRIRLVMAGVSDWLYLSFGNCEVSLLAKDGIYINDFPRWIQHVSLPPGGRAEIVTRCPGGHSNSEHAEHAVVSSAFGNGVASYAGTLFSIRSVASNSESIPLSAWKPPHRPTYLQNLRGDLTVPDCSCKTPMGLSAGPRSVDGHTFKGPKAYLHQWPRDAVVEREISGINKHSFHQHTWPFQLQETPAGNDPYFQAGDWHDTYQNVLDSKARVRFSTVDFSGPEVVHCHALSHSDQGMIGAEIVSGHGPEACACDLLGEEKSIEVYADEHSRSLLAATGVLFVLMLALVVAIARQVVGVTHSRFTDDYATLAAGPDAA